MHSIGRRFGERGARAGSGEGSTEVEGEGASVATDGSEGWGSSLLRAARRAIEGGGGASIGHHRLLLEVSRTPRRISSRHSAPSRLRDVWIPVARPQAIRRTPHRRGGTAGAP